MKPKQQRTFLQMIGKTTGKLTYVTGKNQIKIFRQENCGSFIEFMSEENAWKYVNTAGITITGSHIQS